MAGNREQGPRPAPRRRGGGALRAGQRLGAALALVLLAGTASAGCPKQLGAGLRLSTADGALMLEYRPQAPGLLAELRHDDRPQTAQNARRVSRAVAHGIIGVEALSQNGYLRNSFSADLTQLLRLPQTGVWETGLTIQAGPADRSTAAEFTGSQRVRFIGHDTRTVGGCRYAVWLLEHQRIISRPDGPDSVQLFRQWWAPALGVAIGVTDAVPEGLGPEAPFARIEALD